MLTPREGINAYSALGASKAEAPASRLFALGVLAGFFIAIAGAATNTAASAFAAAPAAKLVCALLFPFGLIMVILTGAELFTGNCLMLLSALEGTARWPGILRNLLIVYLGNFTGAVVTAAACVYSGQLDLGGGALALYTIKLAAAKCALPFGKALLLGVLCNVLVCTAVMLALQSKSVPGKAIGAYVPICLFVLCGFEHCIANMYYIPAGLLSLGNPAYGALAAAAGVELGALHWASFLLNNLLPVTLGNVLGGMGLALLLWFCHGRVQAKSAAAVQR